MEDLSFITTSDGSITLADKSTGEWYHNSAGAYEESLVNYCEPAMAWLNAPGDSRSSLRILDICFGMGYNSFTFLNLLLKSGLSIPSLEIVAVELDPGLLPAMSAVLKQDLYKDIGEAGFRDIRRGKSFQELFQTSSVKDDLLEAELQSENGSNVERITFKLYLNDLRTFVPALVGVQGRDGNEFAITSPKDFDLIFHDPFSPNRVPQFWTKDIFDVYFQLLKKRSGLVFTYSVATAVRAGLLEAGFSILRTKAVGAKSGGTVAYPKSNSSLIDLCRAEDPSPLFFSLDEEELGRLGTRSGVPYRDPDFSRARNEILCHRQDEQDQL